MLRPSEPAPALSGLRRVAKRALLAVGYYGQRLAHFDFPGVAVLCYHSVRGDDEDVPFSQLHVTRETFERHCNLIAETCDPISLADLRAARAGTRALPPRPVIVTFDDGYRGVLEHALPSLERYRVPATVFVCTGAVVDSHHFWFDVLYRQRGEEAVLNAKRVDAAAWPALRDALLVHANPVETHRPMQVAELRRLAASPLIEIGAHTITHPTLALVTPGEQRREIAGCRHTLQELLNLPIDAFAYPYGSLQQDYSPETVKVVREAGFDLAFTTSSSFASIDGDPFQIPRFVMLDSVGEAELAHRLLHSWHVNGDAA